MKILNSLILLLILSLPFSCTTEKRLFEMETWWQGHWENVDDSTFFFSVGSRPVGVNEIRTPQFFTSSKDSIYTNFYLFNTVESNHRKRFKVLVTSEDTYLKIQEIDEEYIIVYGPTGTIGELESIKAEYKKLPFGATPPFPDSVLVPKYW